MSATPIQTEHARRFRELHRAGDPLVLFNAWDAGSARSIAGAGAAAIATGSWSVAAAHGLEDGEKLPRDLALANLARIVAATALPVSVDLESGYGQSPASVADCVAAAIAAGAIGCNLEDADPASGQLRDADAQAARLRAAREAAVRQGLPGFFINARCDAFLRLPREQHDTAVLDDVLARASAYAEAGADGLFVPGLVDGAMIARLCREVALPVNVMVLGGLPPRAELAKLGVARISHGPGPYLRMQAALADAAREALAG